MVNAKKLLLGTICFMTTLFCFGCKKNTTTKQSNITTKPITTTKAIPKNDSRIYKSFINDPDQGFPELRISVENNKKIESKDYYLNCSIDVTNTSDEYSLSSVSGRVKGRGNSTWWFEKRPYKIKFDEKVDLFGFGKAKEWVLLANHNDKSLSRNQLALLFGKLIGASYTHDSTFVDLYVNNEYYGVYQLTEQNEVKKNRVDLSDATTADDMSFLVELDRKVYDEYQGEEIDYFEIYDKETGDQRPYVIQYPDNDISNYSEYREYIVDYMQKAFTATETHDIKEIEKYIDIDSFARSYIVYEIFNNTDVGYSSFYMFKDVGGKLCVGPIWDFDLSSGNINYNDSQYPEFLIDYKNYFFRNLLKCPEYKKLVTDLMKEYIPKFRELLDVYQEQANAREESFNKNFTKWIIMGENVYREPDVVIDILKWDEQLAYLKDWLNKSMDYLETVYK